MGFFGRLFGGGVRKPPGWARGPFGDDVTSFDAFVAVVAEVLEARGMFLGDGDLRTGSTMLGSGRDAREWFLEEAAYDCSRVSRDAWRAIVERSCDRRAGRAVDDDDDLDDDVYTREPASGPPPSWVNASGPQRAWVIGCQSTGVVLLEAGDKDMIAIVLPVVDRAVFRDIEQLGLLRSSMSARRVIVCNAGDAGHLVGTAVARALGLAHAYATDATRPIDRGDALPGEPAGKPVEVRALDSLKEGSLYLERLGSVVFGTWRDGATFACGHPVSLGDLAARPSDIAIGKLEVDGPNERMLDVFMRLKRVVIPANVPGRSHSRGLATAMSELGVTAAIVNGGVPGADVPADDTHGDGVAAAPAANPAPTSESRRLRVLAHMMMDDLDAADALAVEAIAAGDEVADMHHQRAMIALMRGDETSADAHLAQIDTAQSFTSRAIIAARRGDDAGKDLALRALERLPGDVIAIRAAILVHAFLGDKERARAILDAQQEHLGAELALALDRTIDDPPRSFGHHFPEHAKLVFEAARPMLDAGDYEAAEPLLQRAAKWDPENLEILADLGFALSKLQRDAEAIAVYDAAIARGGSLTLLRFNRGNCQLRRQQFDQAAADFRACIEVKADWHEARVNLVSALFASGDKKGAREELDQLQQLGGPPHLVRSLEQMLAGTL